MDVILYAKGEYFKIRQRRNVGFLRTVVQTEFIIFTILEVSDSGISCIVPGVR